MERLSIYDNLTLDDLRSKYELCVTDLINKHQELTTVLSDLHSTYLEAFSRSRGKSVAERNRDADFDTKELYRDVITLRGQINYTSEQRDMLVNLINWRMSVPSTQKPDLHSTYPHDHDKGTIGRA